MKDTDINIQNIAFDGKRALYNHTGLGNYSRFAIESISEEFPGIRLSLYSQKVPVGNRWLELHPQLEVVSRSKGESVPGLWRHYRGISKSLRANRPGIYHGLSNELPFDIAKAGLPAVVTIHDLIFRRIPENYKPIDRWLYDTKFRAAARNATRIIAISECTKKDIVELYDVNPDKIDVVYQGCNPIFSAPVSESCLKEVKATYNLPEKYIIMVGTVEQRKNQMLAVESLPLIDSEVKLVIVGRERNDYGEQITRRISQLGLTDRVIRLTGVPTRHLPTLYSMSVAAAYPSRYEGFGLPVIEAICSGTPVIAATGSCLEEAGGPGAVYVNPDSPEEFASRANEIIANPELGRRMVEAGKEYVQRFNTRDFAENIMHVYHRAITDYRNSDTEKKL